MDDRSMLRRFYCRVVALNGAVTLDTNDITVCAIPEPSGLALVGLPVLALLRRRRRRA